MGPAPTTCCLGRIASNALPWLRADVKSGRERVVSVFCLDVRDSLGIDEQIVKAAWLVAGCGLDCLFDCLHLNFLINRGV